MGLTIDDRESERLAHLLARQSGLTVEQVVREALSGRYEHLSKQRESLRQDIRELRAQFRALPQGAESIPYDGFLYDEYGLPI